MANLEDSKRRCCLSRPSAMGSAMYLKAPRYFPEHPWRAFALESSTPVSSKSVRFAACRGSSPPAARCSLSTCVRSPAAINLSTVGDRAHAFLMRLKSRSVCILASFVKRPQFCNPLRMPTSALNSSFVSHSRCAWGKAENNALGEESEPHSKRSDHNPESNDWALRGTCSMLQGFQANQSEA